MPPAPSESRADDAPADTGPVDTAPVATSEAAPADDPSDGPADDHGRQSSSFLRDLVVTVVLFVALVGGAAAWLWIRDAVDGRGDAVASGQPTSAPTDAPAVTTSPTPSGDQDLLPPATVTATPSERVSRWVPVVEVLDPGTSPVTARDRAMVVTALGFPVVALPSDRVDGFDGDGWVLVGTERATLDEAIASCTDRALLATCQAHTLAD